MSSRPTNTGASQIGRHTSNRPDSTFVFFPCLPTELQINIFELAMPAPRIVDFRHTKWADENEEWSFRRYYSKLRQRLPVPPLLHTCQLSRAIALKSFSLFNSEDGPLPFGYINFELDTLSLTQRSMNDPQDLDWNIVLEAFRTLVRKEDRSRVRRLQTRFYHFLTAASLIKEILDNFPNLEVLIIRFDRVRPFMTDEGSMNPLALSWTSIDLGSSYRGGKGPRIECLLMLE